jgi:hypothetical protein
MFLLGACGQLVGSDDDPVILQDEASQCEWHSGRWRQCTTSGPRGPLSRADINCN